MVAAIIELIFFREEN